MIGRTLDEHLFGSHPRNILSLDGGGVRALVALGFLERIEALLREHYGGDEGFRLSDHFDLIGGTSSGALVAAGLALGMSVDEVRASSLQLARRAFAERRWFGGLLSPKFPGQPFLAEIRRIVGEHTLGSPALRTGLAICAKRLDTGSPWVFHNNPRGRYFHAPADDAGGVANDDIPLYEILRASAAAPTYFDPERIVIAERVDGLFVDGGVSPYNNPSLLLLMMATVPSYGYDWPTGVDRLNLISIGTGIGGPLPTADELHSMMSVRLAVNSLESMITDCAWQAQAMLQWLGESAEPWQIDGEGGTFSNHRALPHRLLRFQRYNVLLESAWLERELGAQLDCDELTHLSQIDRPEAAERLFELARTAARRQVKLEHLRGGASA